MSDRTTPNGKPISKLTRAQCQALIDELRDVAETPAQRSWASEMQTALNHYGSLTENQVFATQDAVQRAGGDPFVQPPAQEEESAVPEKAKRNYTFWTGRKGFKFIRENKIKSMEELRKASPGLCKNFRDRAKNSVEFAIRLLGVFEENGGKPHATVTFKEAYALRERRRAGRVARTEVVLPQAHAVTTIPADRPLRWYERLYVRLGLAAAGLGLAVLLTARSS
jgi:hypothetical protein